MPVPTSKSGKLLGTCEEPAGKLLGTFFSAVTIPNSGRVESGEEHKMAGDRRK
jgi:hypothetical protein